MKSADKAKVIISQKTGLEEVYTKDNKKRKILYVSELDAVTTEVEI